MRSPHVFSFSFVTYLLSPRFDMMGKTLYKTYANLTNIVIRVSDCTPEGKNHAVLVSAHLDSTSTAPCLVPVQRTMHSPSASCLTVYACSPTPRWTPSHAISTPSSSVSAHSMSFHIAHTCVLAPATRLQCRFLHIILSRIPASINLEGGFRELYSLPFSYGVA